MESGAKLCVIGSVNLDLVVHAETLPKPGDTVLGGELRFLPGGKAANQAVAARRAGASVIFGGRVGSDAFGDDLRASFAGDGVDCTYVDTVDGSSGVAFITIDSAAENQIVVAPGANATLDAVAIGGLIDRGLLTGVATVLAPCETPLDGLAAAFHQAKSQGATTMLNTAPAQQLPEGLLQDVDVLIANEGEIVTLTGAGDLAQAIERARANVSIVIVTVGGDGAIVADSTGQRTIAPYPIEPVDTVGAGDAFCGNLAAAWHQATLDGSTPTGAMIDAIVSRANAAGAVTAMGHGARSSPTVDELESFIASR